VPPRTVAHDGPVYNRPFARTGVVEAAAGGLPTELPRPHTDPREHAAGAAGAANNADKAWITDQYDRYVRGNTALAQPEDAGVLRIDEESGRGVAIATDCNARFANSIPTRARSWRWPRRTATSRPPVRYRWRSPTV
jgi:phosphoribosylformylglycinamidine synthase